MDNLTRQARYKLKNNRKSVSTEVVAEVKDEIDYLRNKLNIGLPDIIKSGILVYRNILEKQQTN